MSRQRHHHGTGRLGRARGLLVLGRGGCWGGVGGEDAAEVGREGAERVGVGLAVERVLEAVHAEGEVVALAAEVGGVVGEVAEAVLVARGPQAWSRFWKPAA